MPLSRNSGCKGTTFLVKTKNKWPNIFRFRGFCVILKSKISKAHETQRDFNTDSCP